MIEAVLIAAGVGVALGALVGWKVRAGLGAGEVARLAQAAAAVVAALELERKAHAAVRQALADERGVWKAEEARRAGIEAALRDTVERTRKERDDALRADPARAGDRLDGVLSGSAPRSAGGNAPAGYDVRRAAAAARRAPGDDDSTR